MKQQMLRVIRDHGRPIVISGVTAFAGGAVVGYFLGKRKSDTTQLIHEVLPIFDHDTNGVIGHVDEVVEDEEGVKAVGHVIDADAFKAMMSRKMDSVTVEPTTEDEDEPEVVTESIFAGNDEEWDYQEELEKRNTNEPYVLHKDEYFAQETDYTHISLTYYEGDNIMADESDSPVYNWDAVIGDLNFGHGSAGDPDVFYVRNDKLRAEYEVIRHEGMFSVEVNGLDPEDVPDRNTLRHSRFPLTDTN